MFIWVNMWEAHVVHWVLTSLSPQKGPKDGRSGFELMAKAVFLMEKTRNHALEKKRGHRQVFQDPGQITGADRTCGILRSNWTLGLTLPSSWAKEPSFPWQLFPLCTVRVLFGEQVLENASEGADSLRKLVQDLLFLRVLASGSLVQWVHGYHFQAQYRGPDPVPPQPVPQTDTVCISVRVRTQS